MTIKYCKLADGCIKYNNKCKECEVANECDYPWIQEIWKKNSDLLTPLMPGWVKPDFNANHVMTITGDSDFCIFGLPKKRDAVVIQDICVDESARGQGISKKIINTLMEEFDKDIITKCVKDSSADKFWSHLGEKISEEPSKQRDLCVYFIENKNKKQTKANLW